MVDATQTRNRNDNVTIIIKDLENAAATSLTGANRRTVSQVDLQHPFALTMYKNVLYWTDWQTKSCSKKTGAGRKAVLGFSLTHIEIHAYD